MIKKINSVIEKLTRMCQKAQFPRLAKSLCHCEERSDEAISKRINPSRGQTALVLILLTAAALIFLAITLNWGRISQTKSLLTIGADEAASQLASDAASYGEMQKQTYLKDENQVTALSGILIAVVGVILAIVVAVLSFGVGGVLVASVVGEVISIIAAVMAIANLVLQLVVVQPGITALWNNLQKNQPIQQQFFEQGISTALQATITDQVNITDYLDWNANGLFGNNASHSPNDTVGRFALFYSDRLKMLNQPDIPQVVNFYDQLGALINGESCAENASDAKLNFGIALNPNCQPANLGGIDCSVTPSDPICQLIIPNTYQLNDRCTANSNPYNLNGTVNPAYNPYCDPCCQTVSVPDPFYSATTFNPLHPNPNISIRPTNCPTLGTDAQGNPIPDTSAYGAPANCLINNPFNSTPAAKDSVYTLLYDPTYQKYSNTPTSSLLDLFGRDQQAPLPQPPGSPPIPPQQLQEPPFAPLTLQGNFPNGIYPFFWLAKNYSLEVNTINPAGVTAGEYHWCTSNVAQPASYVPLSLATQGTYPELIQLGSAPNTPLQFDCTQSLNLQDCCVNYIGGTIVGGVLLGGPGIPPPMTANPAVPGTTTDTIDVVGDPTISTGTIPNQNLALNPVFGEGGASTWIAGDNQFCSVATNGSSTGQCADGSSCSASNPCPSECNDGTACSNPCDDGSTCTTSACSYGTYNGSSTVAPGGSCEWTNTITTTPPNPTPDPLVSTADALDDTVHTLSDFIKFSNSFLSEDVGTLSSTFSSWFQNADDWVDPATGRLTGVTNNLNAWGSPTGPVASWLAQTYVSDGAWCVPSQGLLMASNDINNDCGGAATCASHESTYIDPNAGDPNWGQLSAVTNCLYYNSNKLSGDGSVYNYTQCVNALQTQSTIGNPPCAALPAACSSVTLGRSLAGTPLNPFKPSSGPPQATTPLSAISGDPSCASEPLGSVSGFCSVGSFISTTPNATVPGAAGTTIGTNITNQNVQLCPYSYQSPYSCNCAYVASGVGCSCNASGVGSCPPSAKTCSCSCTWTCQTCFQTISGTCQEAPSSPTPATTTTFKSNSCDPTTAGTYANWAENSQTLFTDEAPKFYLRYEYLQDLSGMAGTMKSVFFNGGAELQGFLSGPAAALIAADKNPPTATLPNSVIYGWQDPQPTSGSGGCTDSNGNRAGCAHIVKVTAYSPGRSGSANGAAFMDSLPFVKTTTGWFTRSYTLNERDGYVYVSVKRWDEEHNTVNFPNNHPLWQFLFHNPTTTNISTTGSGIIGSCQGIPMTTNTGSIGYGLEPSTVLGLEYNNQITPTDQTALGKAFMLNDEGNGQIDPNAGPGSAFSGTYATCLQAANALLATAPESHACMEYIGSIYANNAVSGGCSTQGSTVKDSCVHDYDYSLKFVNCNSVPGGTPPDDLTGSGSG